jgi:hypothetical protein
MTWSTATEHAQSTTAENTFARMSIQRQTFRAERLSRKALAARDYGALLQSMLQSTTTEQSYHSKPLMQSVRPSQAAQAAYHRHATQRLFGALLQSMLQNINADHAARLQRLFRALLQSMPQNINAEHAARLLQGTPTSVPCYGHSREMFALRRHCYRACYIASLMTCSCITSEKQTEKEVPVQT